MTVLHILKMQKSLHFFQPLILLLVWFIRSVIGTSPGMGLSATQDAKQVERNHEVMLNVANDISGPSKFSMLMNMSQRSGMGGYDAIWSRFTEPEKDLKHKLCIILSGTQKHTQTGSWLFKDACFSLLQSVNAMPWSTLTGFKQLDNNSNVCSGAACESTNDQKASHLPSQLIKDKAFESIVKGSLVRQLTRMSLMYPRASVTAPIKSAVDANNYVRERLSRIRRSVTTYLAITYLPSPLLYSVLPFTVIADIALLPIYAVAAVAGVALLSPLLLIFTAFPTMAPVFVYPTFYPKY